jgi:hypothetical protein
LPVWSVATSTSHSSHRNSIAAFTRSGVQSPPPVQSLRDDRPKLIRDEKLDATVAIEVVRRQQTSVRQDDGRRRDRNHHRQDAIVPPHKMSHERRRQMHCVKTLRTVTPCTRPSSPWLRYGKQHLEGGTIGADRDPWSRREIKKRRLYAVDPGSMFGAFSHRAFHCVRRFSRTFWLAARILEHQHNPTDESRIKGRFRAATRS